MKSSMRQTDAFAWNMERDPTLRSTIVVVAWLDKSPNWSQLVEKLDRATRTIRMFRQRVVESRGPFSTPRWVDDEYFDLSWHLRRMDSPEPHTPGTVIEIARNATMTAFDHAHPLWEFTLVEHLDGDRAALVMKVHHALTDGLGGMELALELFDLEAVPPQPSSTDIDDSLTIEPTGGKRLARVVPTARRALRHPVATATEWFETARSIARAVAPVNETCSPIMKRRSTARELGVVQVELADLKRAATAAGGSVNDAFMAAVSDGLRRYHDLRGAPVDELRVTFPISIRTPDDPPGGNRITLIRFAVPVSDTAPASRIRAIAHLCRAARDEQSLRHTALIAGSLNVLPRTAIGNMLKHVDFLASDIPGFAFPVYLAGARMENYVVFAPTVGTAVNFALLSYTGTCTVGISMDSSAVANGDQLIACVRDGFEAVLALGGSHDPVRLPLAGDRQPAAPMFAERGDGHL